MKKESKRYAFAALRRIEAKCDRILALCDTGRSGREEEISELAARLREVAEAARNEAARHSEAVSRELGL